MAVNWEGGGGPECREDEGPWSEKALGGVKGWMKVFLRSAGKKCWGQRAKSVGFRAQTEKSIVEVSKESRMQGASRSMCGAWEWEENGDFQAGS